MQKAILILAAALAAFLSVGGVSDDAEIHGRVVRVADSARSVSRADGPQTVTRSIAPVRFIWLDTGCRSSTNSNKSHNRNCENSCKTLGYPCSKDDGTPCVKCGG